MVSLKLVASVGFAGYFLPSFTTTIHKLIKLIISSSNLIVGRGKKEVLCGECNGAGFIGGFLSTFDE